MNKELIENIFQKTKVRYQGLQSVNTKLVFTRELFFTMRTSVSLRSLFREKRTYLVLVNTKRNNIISELSEDNITGWFAHELAHIIDYETMSNFELLIFTVKYILNSKFRVSVEKKVNVIACENGFVKELFLVWIKFLSMDNFSPRYKEYIKKYYPDWKDVQHLPESQLIGKEIYESFK